MNPQEILLAAVHPVSRNMGLKDWRIAVQVILLERRPST